MSAPAHDHDRLYEKWVGWLEIIQDGLVRMHANRAIWREIVEMLDSNEEIPHRFWIRNWITEHYGATQAMAVRRMVEARDDVISLGTLFEAIRRNPQVITRARYFEICKPDNDYIAETTDSSFDQWAGPGGDHLDPHRVQAKLVELQEMADGISYYVDKRIAHRDRQDPEPFTFEELDAALDALGSALQELSLLLRCVSLVRVEPYFQTPWQQAFMIPWAPPERVERWQEIQEYLRRTTRQGEEGDSPS